VGRVGGSGGGIGGSSAGGRGFEREAGFSEAGGSHEASITLLAALELLVG